MLHEGQPMYDTAPLSAFDTGDVAERDVLASGSVGSNPLSPPAAAQPQLPFAPVGAAGTADWGDHEHSIPQQLRQLEKNPPPEVPPLTPAAEDFVHEILAMNTLAMEQCYAAIAATSGATLVGAAVANSTPNVTAASEEPMRILSEAYMRVDETSAQDFPVPLLDELKTTTLNNMGVVECNRGQPRQALSHFEAARQLEENNGMASPSIALNMCAAYNALRMFDKATAAALETIDMLRSLALQRRRNRRLNATATALLGGSGLPWHGSGGGAMDGAKDGDTSTTDLLLEAAAAPKIADSQNEALWGAAWNNLAVAQINTARGSKDTSEYTNALSLFQNAMRATQELLGMQHPMSKAVVETFRSVRRALRYHGAFKQHRSLLRAPLPPVDPREREWEERQVEVMPGHTRHGTLQQQRQQLTITFRGEVTGGQKVVERLDSTPYPGAASEPYQKQQRIIPLSSTLCHASAVYGNPHPLLYSPPPSGQYAESAPLSFSGSVRATVNQYDGSAAAPGRAMSAADSSRQGRNRGLHSHTTRSRSAGVVHSGAAATSHVQQSKMLLLAAPASGVATTTTYYPLEVPSEAVAKSAEHRGPMLTPATVQSAWHDAGDPSAGTHELFRGMWVTADPHYVHRGPRVFGRPAYYTIATTLGVTEDGVGGGASVAGTGTGAAASTTQTDSAPRPVLPTLTYSSSGSEEDNDAEGEEGHGCEGGAMDVRHHTSVSTDAPSSSASPKKNTLAETSRMTSS
ncbi:hypothetical protein CGC20_20130 [Leishmania donovani]|uniref:Uncharacterized protein n=1 Tax=Leishmania donovani TaxID=5661 RepID=A0A504XN43_LEIDO|nr:hypothetical protein CGC20_20130 [Leishmania donovani]